MQEERSLYTAMVDEAKSDRLLQQESHCWQEERSLYTAMVDEAKSDRLLQQDHLLRGHSTQPWWTRQRVTASCSRSHTADCAGGEVTLHSHGGRGKE